MPHLDIQLLGNFVLFLDGRPCCTLFSGRLQTLIAYLLLHREAPQSRQHIAFLLWPDTTEKQALGNLRTLYYRLREKLPHADLFLYGDRHTIQWLPDAPYTLDVAAFEAAVAQASTTADWQQALNLYHGPLLPDLYEEWLEPERERLHNCFFQASQTLVSLLESRRRYAEAIQVVQHLLQYDPLHEATYRCLMRQQALSGAKADALRTYHTCATKLEEELGVAPDPSTRALHEQLLRGDAEPASLPMSAPEVAAPQLVGRDEEWNRLQHAWQIAAAGHAGMILISGEAGVGKSRLSAELLQWASRQGVDTVATRSYEAEGELAYAPVLTWLRSPLLRPAWKKLDDVFLTELARLAPEILVERLDLPAPLTITGSGQRQRLFEALARAVLARGHPLLLQIDDLQWCDQATLEWLHFLLRFNPRARLLIIGAYRPEEISSGHPLTLLRRELSRSQQLEVVQLQRLTRAATASLTAQLAGRPLAEATVARLYQESEGNPLFVIEMMRSGLPAWDTLPATIRDMIQSRFARLTPQARELLAQAAVIGRAFNYDLLAQCSGMAEESLVTRLDELWRRRIIREHGAAEYDFSHDKMRDVAYAELSNARRRLLHGRVAGALERLHASHIEPYAAQIAAHFERADMLEEAIPYYQRAASAARRLYATAEAISYLRRALRLLSSISETVPASFWQKREAELYESLGDSLQFTAQYEEAQDAYEMALTAAGRVKADPLWRCRLQRKAGSACLPQHDYEAALHYFDLARSSLGPAAAAAGAGWWREWIDLQQERKYACYWLNRGSELAAILEEGQPVLAKYGTPLQRALFFEPTIFLRRDRFTVSDEVLGYARQWLAANLELEDPVRIAAARFMTGFVLLWHGDFAEAGAEMREALRLTAHTGDLNLRARCLTYLSVLHRKQEQPEEVALLTARSLAAATEAKMPEYVATGKANQAWLAWRAGDSQLAKTQAHSALKLWQALPAGHASCAFQWTAIFPLMAIAWSDQELEAAIAWARLLLDPTQQALPDKLATLLKKAIDAGEQGQVRGATQLLHEALSQAREMHYL